MSQERLKREVKLLSSADTKSCISRRLAQQRVTLSDLEWPFQASRAISAVAELLVHILHDMLHLHTWHTSFVAPMSASAFQH